MAEEQEKESTSGGLRFRLPKLFAETVEHPTASEPEPASETAPAARATPKTKAAARSTAAADEGTTVIPQVKESRWTQPGAAAGGEPAVSTAFEAAATPQSLEPSSALFAQMQDMQEELRRMHDVVIEINDRENAHEKVFNTLHAELREYKTDFIYEHFKPVVRPLLFLYDSLEQFDAEIALYERPNQGERRQTGLSPQLVRDNIAFFRDQLTESLRICEVTPMEMPNGPFNPKLHKVIDVVPADESQDGIIQRVVRSGWYLNGQLLRAAEVIVGKKM